MAHHRVIAPILIIAGINIVTVRSVTWTALMPYIHGKTAKVRMAPEMAESPEETSHLPAVLAGCDG